MQLLKAQLGVFMSFLTYVTINYNIIFHRIHKYLKKIIIYFVGDCNNEEVYFVECKWY